MCGKWRSRCEHGAVLTLRGSSSCPPATPRRCICSQLTAFVVARAASDASNMWLFGKNDWGPPWTGYGIAVSRDGLHPWPHLGLGRDGAAKGAQLRHVTSLGQDLSIVEIRYDGQRFSQLLMDTETGAWRCVPASWRTSATCSSAPAPSPLRRANTSRARSRRCCSTIRPWMPTNAAASGNTCPHKYGVPLADDGGAGRGVRRRPTADDGRRTPHRKRARLRRQKRPQCCGATGCIKRPVNRCSSGPRWTSTGHATWLPAILTIIVT